MDDVRALHEARGFGLALKAARDIGLAGEFGVDELEGCLLADRNILPFVDGSHASATDEAHDPPLAPDDLARHDLAKLVL